MLFRSTEPRAYRYARLLENLDESTDALMARQIDDPTHPDHGGFRNPDDGLANPNGVSAAAAYGYAYLLPEAARAGDLDLVERIEVAAAWGRRRRTAAGRFDLLSTNFDSSPDTGFTVQALAPVVRAAQQVAAKDEGAARIVEALGELMRTAAPGMVSGGFHTPNHRWVLTSALALCSELFPDLADQLMPTIDAYLGESIDINEDGEFTERSTSVYNPVCDRALRLAAESLGRQDLLAAVRANLEMSYHLMHEDATVVTSFSTRQDRGSRAVPVGLADAFYWIARHEKDARFAAMAEWLVATGGPGTPWTLEPFLTHPEWRDESAVCLAPPETSYRKPYLASGLWRVRRDRSSATVAAGMDSPFSLRHGEAELSAVRVSSTYFATGQFVGEGMEMIDSGAGTRLTHPGRNSMTHYPEGYEGPVYWLPFGDDTKVDSGNWKQVRPQRQTYDMPPQQIQMTVREVSAADGETAAFDLHLCTEGGVEGVPFQVVCVFEPGGIIETGSAIMETPAGASAFLRDGDASYRVGSDIIRVGPGSCEHTMWHMHNSVDDPDRFRLLITLRSPIDYTLQIRTQNYRA
ncbi:MAG: hypothetical protein HN712_30090 [Gemmatimonadetes bacterium]|jgi:hypothetical protein|nr:hypothetical protein [Gemmatimonadota bacterium]MBT7864594.1 hypothetical protein [Gemmatimonadota bacterium]